MPSSSPHIIDVRPVRPECVAVTVRAAVRDLNAGDCIVIVHDRDPEHIPSILAEMSDSVEWCQLCDGGDVGAIRIVRREPTAPP